MEKKSLREYRPLTLRLWHWFNALVIVGLLFTVLLRKTLLSWRTNSALIANKLEAAGQAITPDLAKDIAVTIRNPLWDIHIVLGYLLGFLLVARILIAYIVEKKCLLTNALASIKNKSLFHQETRHYYAVKALYVLFYLMTLFMVISGLILIFKQDLSLEKATATSIKEIHEVSMWFFVAFTALHIIGVIVSENRQDAGLVSDMISGGNKKAST